MKGTKANLFKKKKEGKPSFPYFIIFCLVMLCWGAALFYVWKSGKLHSAKNPSLIYVDGVLNNAETTLRGGIANLRQVVPPNHSQEGSTILQHPEEEVEDEGDMHVVFSTDCSPFQDWQTIVLFYSAIAVGQKGPVTRIASGCTAEKQKELTDLYKKLYPKYHVHFTPDFSRDVKKQQSYVYYNKPTGMKHWLEFAVPKIKDNIVVALLDPDMILVRPLISKMRGQPNNLYNKKLKESDIMENVTLGHPAAQMYGLGAPWTNDKHLKFNRTRVCGIGSPCLETTTQFGEQHYSVGPPLIMKKPDMYKLSVAWTQFVPRVFEKYPHLLAEMYAYSMAAAHVDLPHQQFENFMVSNDGAYGEGWPLVDIIEDTCKPPVDGIYYPGVPLPNLVHYCQNFRAGIIGFAKRAVPRDIFSCNGPLLLEPPIDLGSSTYRIKKGVKEEIGSKMLKRNAYVLCILHRTINGALIDYKKRMCDASTSVNYEKTLIILPQG